MKTNHNKSRLLDNGGDLNMMVWQIPPTSRTLPNDMSLQTKRTQVENVRIIFNICLFDLQDSVWQSSRIQKCVEKSTVKEGTILLLYIHVTMD